MNSAPSATLIDFARAPVLRLNWVAYVSSSVALGIRDNKPTKRVSDSNVPAKGTGNCSIKSQLLEWFRRICRAQQSQQSSMIRL